MTDRKRFHDPVTGEDLSLGEELSWLIQGLIRRWPFLILTQLVTALVWILGDALTVTWWNYVWSDLAIIIESVVGIGMFSLTRRDHVKLQQIERLEQTQIETLEAVKTLGIACDIALKELLQIDGRTKPTETPR